MGDKLTPDEKYKLYTFLMEHGFDSSLNPQLVEESLGSSNLIELKETLDSYKNNEDLDNLNKWLKNILSLKQHYKYETFMNLFSEVLIKKAKSLPTDDKYREAYYFLSKVLVGEFPDIKNLDDHTTTVILLLIQDINNLMETVNNEDINKCFIVEENEQSSSNNGSNTTHDLIMKRLKSLYKFQRMEEFLNPLQISKNANQKVLENIFK